MVRNVVITPNGTSRYWQILHFRFPLCAKRRWFLRLIRPMPGMRSSRNLMNVSLLPGPVCAFYSTICLDNICEVAGAASEPVPPLPKGLPMLPAAGPPPANPGFSETSNNLPPRGVPLEQVASSSVLTGKPELPRLSSAPNFSLPRTSQQSFAPRKTSLGQSVPGHVSPGNGNTSPSGEGFGAHQMQGLQGAQRTPSLNNAPSGASYPARKPSAVNSPPPSSFAPGQVMPPARSASMTSMTKSPPPVVPDQDASLGGAPHRVYSPPVAQRYAQQPSLQHQPSVHSLHSHPSMHSPHPQVSPHLLHQRPSIHQHLPHPQSAPPQSQSTNFSQQPQPFPSQPMGQRGPPHGIPPPRPPSEPPSSSGRLQKASSSRSLHSQYEYGPGPGPGPAPPLPSLPGALPMPSRPYAQRHDSFSSVNSANSATMKPLLPSQQINSRANSFSEPTFQDPSPPTSPIEESKPLGPVKSTISEKTKCRVFHQQQHAQWKSLGSAHLTLYRQEPTNVKQLVVEADSKDKTTLISTIVLTDGVERVGKTGVAVELSDTKGARTGIIYMIQLRNESAAVGLFNKLLAGSDRSNNLG